MALTFNGSNNTIAGVAAGGINDNVVDNGTMADDAIGVAELSATGTASSSTYLRGDNAWSAISAGITEYDVWRVTSDVNNPGVITSNWERSDHANFEKIGTGMTESSGVFTFPSTGKWDISMHIFWKGTAEHDYTVTRVHLSTDSGSNFATYANTYGYILNSGGVQYNSDTCRGMIDITDTSTMKVRMYGGGSNAPDLRGSTDTDYSFATFIKVGDT